MDMRTDVRQVTISIIEPLPPPPDKKIKNMR